MLPLRQEAFTKAFIQHYSRISVALVSSLDRSRISNRVVHISVQLLSPEGLACKMVDDHHLLPIMLGSLRHMLNGVLVCSAINSECAEELSQISINYVNKFKLFRE